MNISKRDKALLLGLLGIILVAVSYFFVYKPSVEKKAELETQLATLQQQEAELVELENNMDFYKSEIERLEGEKAEYLACFPADIEEESEIMYAVELENNVDIKFNSLNYGTPIDLLGTGEQMVEGETAEGTEAAPTIGGYCLPLTASYLATYNGLKNTITHTNMHQNRMVIDQVTASYDASTGNLVGDMTINMFYMTGTENAYTEPYVPSMGIGVSNIFGTIELRDTF